MSAETAAPSIFDRALIASRLQKAGTGNFVIDLVLEDLQHRLMPIARNFEKALMLAPDASALPKELMGHDKPVKFAHMATLIPGIVPMADSEALQLPASDYDLIVSLLDLQMVNDVPGFLSTIRRHLRPDGLMLTALIGGESLTELRQAWLEADAMTSQGAAPRVIPMIDVRSAGALLQRAGFALPMADLDHHVVRYQHPLALMQELKQLGAANPLIERNRRWTTKTQLATAAEIYMQRFTDTDGRVRATLDILWLSGWAPHESQQKPLKPGSATARLSDVLCDKS